MTHISFKPWKEQKAKRVAIKFKRKAHPLPRLRGLKRVIGKEKPYKPTTCE